MSSVLLLFLFRVRALQHLPGILKLKCSEYPFGCLCVRRKHRHTAVSKLWICRPARPRSSFSRRVTGKGSTWARSIGASSCAKMRSSLRPRARRRRRGRYGTVFPRDPFPPPTYRVARCEKKSFPPIYRHSTTAVVLDGCASLAGLFLFCF